MHHELSTKTHSDVNVQLQSQLIRVPFQYLSNVFCVSVKAWLMNVTGCPFCNKTPPTPTSEASHSMVIVA